MITKTASSILNRSTTKSVDAANINIGNYPSYIGVLGEMQLPGSNYQEIIQQPGKLLSHLFFSFIVVADEEDFVFIALNSGLSATIISYARSQALGIVSGSLEQWRTAIINCCIPRSEYTIREIFNQVFMQFEKLKLSPLWYDFTKKDQQDGTFSLEYKK